MNDIIQRLTALAERRERYYRPRIIVHSTQQYALLEDNGHTAEAVVDWLCDAGAEVNFRPESRNLAHVTFTNDSQLVELKLRFPELFEDI